MGIYVLHPHNLRVLLKLSKNLIAQWIGDLCIHARIADVPMSQVIGNIPNTPTGFKEMHRDGVGQGMNMAGSDACCLRIVSKEMLDHAFLHRALSTNEEVGRDVPPHSQVGTEKFRRVPPQGFLAADTIFQPPYPDTMIFYVDVLHGQGGRFVYSQAIVINEREQGAVAWRGDDFE
jgi:hypothetical protein